MDSIWRKDHADKFITQNAPSSESWGIKHGDAKQSWSNFPGVKIMPCFDATDLVFL